MKQVDTNFLGTVRVTQAFIPYFREAKNGLFINVTSIGGHTVFPLTSIYNGTKWAVGDWSECLSIELSMFNISVLKQWHLVVLIQNYSVIMQMQYLFHSMKQLKRKR